MTIPVAFLLGWAYHRPPESLDKKKWELDETYPITGTSFSEFAPLIRGIKDALLSTQYLEPKNFEKYHFRLDNSCVLPHHLSRSSAGIVGFPSINRIGILYFFAFFLIVLTDLISQAWQMDFHPIRIKG